MTETQTRALIDRWIEHAIAPLRERIEALERAAPVRNGPCQCCGEVADLKCGPSRFGPEDRGTQ